MVSREIMEFIVVQLGPLDRMKLEDAVGIANSAQDSFEFTLAKPRLPLGHGYKLPNGGFDLERAVRDHLRHRYHFDRPVIFFTSAPYSDADTRRLPEYYYFSCGHFQRLPGVSVVSTYLWDRMRSPRSVITYMLLQLAAIAIDDCTAMDVHTDTRGCVFDYCDEPRDIQLIFNGDALCEQCERILHGRLRTGDISIQELAASQRILTAALRRKRAFVAMPFIQQMQSTYDAVARILRGAEWRVTRADDVGLPRRITDRILLHLLMSDLLVADITGRNPNVFYEIGIAHAIGCDVVMLTQERRIPFDVASEQAIIYRATRMGLARMGAKLRRLAGVGSSS